MAPGGAVLLHGGQDTGRDHARITGSSPPEGAGARTDLTEADPGGAKGSERGRCCGTALIHRQGVGLYGCQSVATMLEV